MAHGANGSAGVYTDDKGGLAKTALTVAAASCDEHVLTELVTSGANVNQSLGRKGTVLHHYCDNDKLVNLLVRLGGGGADKNARGDAAGETVFSSVLQRCAVWI